MDNQNLKPWASVVAIYSKEGWLFIKRSQKLRSFPGRWALPGGRIEPDEEPILAACREIWEEVGVKINPMDLLSIGNYGENGKIIYFWIYSNPVLDVKINDESDDWGWFKTNKILEINPIPIPSEIFAIFSEFEKSKDDERYHSQSLSLFGEDWMD